MTALVGAVVVHHRSYETVRRAVVDLIAEGISIKDIVVVDNSIEEIAEGRLRRVLPAGVRVLPTPNRGYGAAVNYGVQALQRAKPYDFLVVATHEVRISAGSVGALEHVMAADDRVGAAGPTLITERGGRDEVWSTGGTLTRWARMPQHHDHRNEPEKLLNRPLPGAVRRRWLDGAFVMYRASLLSELRVNEIFFLYMEEVELHLRILRAGFEIMWVPAAVVHQSSNGTPPFYFARNLLILHRLNQNRLSITLAPIVALRSAFRQAVRQRSARPVIESVRGIGRGMSERLVK